MKILGMCSACCLIEASEYSVTKRTRVDDVAKTAQSLWLGVEHMEGYEAKVARAISYVQQNPGPTIIYALFVNVSSTCVVMYPRDPI